MRKIAGIFLGVALGCLHGPVARAQALPAGGTLQDKWQVGVAGSLVNSGYVNTAIGGGMLYGTYTFMPYFSVEARTHYARKADGEREFSATGGYRFNFPVGRLVPYAGGLVGVGHFTDAHPSVTGNDTNSLVISYWVGLEFPVSRHLNLRLADVEAQVWSDFPPNGINPVVYSAGLAWHR
jgi:hypothetical protein